MELRRRLFSESIIMIAAEWPMQVLKGPALSFTKQQQNQKHGSSRIWTQPSAGVTDQHADWTRMLSEPTSREVDCGSAYY
jgi:hypothetical protein